MQYKVSQVKRFNQVIAEPALEQALQNIRIGEKKSDVEKIREIFRIAGKKDADTMKKNLLNGGYTFSGTFNKIRAEKYLHDYNGIVVLDYDDIPKELQMIKQKASQCRFSFAVFISTKGNGLKILVRSDNEAKYHNQAYAEVLGLYDTILDKESDYGGGTGVARLCYYSYDPELYYNPNADVFKTIFNKF